MNPNNVPQKLSLELDLNSSPPPMENSPREGPSTGGGVPLAAPLIDVEAMDDDDDVIESSPRTFEQAKINARRTGRRHVEVDSETQTMTVIYEPYYPDLQTINDFYIDLGGIIQPVIEPEPEPVPKEKTPEPVPREKTPEPVPREKTPEPLKRPSFDCPICMGPLEEEMSTRCGHIFCKKCIKTALALQGTCPTCRKRVTARTLLRVFLPSPN